jgi:hypothetical protein
LGPTIFALLGPEMFLGLVILPDNGMGVFEKNKGMMMPMMTVIMPIIFVGSMGWTLIYLG